MGITSILKVCNRFIKSREPDGVMFLIHPRNVFLLASSKSRENNSIFYNGLFIILMVSLPVGWEGGRERGRR